MRNEELYPEILKKYLRNLRDIESKTQTTITDYMNGIHMFLAYIYMKKHNIIINFDTQLTKVNIKCITNKFLNNIKKKDILEFLEYLQERGNAQSTKHQRLMAIRSFWDYLLNMEIATKDITKGIKIPYKYKEQKYFSHKQMKQLLNAIKESNTSKKVRDYTIILMFLLLGLRNSELRNIKIDDINMKTGKLRILGKGQRIRYTYCKENIIESIEEWLEVRKYIKIMKGEEEYLFLSQQGRRINRDYLNVVIKKYCAMAGFNPKDYHVHSLRHSAITDEWRRTKDIKTTQSFSGHKSVEVLMKTYVHNNEEELRESIMASDL